MIKAYFEDIAGATAIEYGLIAALIGIAVIGSSLAVNGSVNTMFVKIQTAMN